MVLSKRLALAAIIGWLMTNAGASMSLADGCGCPCPQDAICLWDPIFEQPCEFTSPDPGCECQDKKCNATVVPFQIQAMHFRLPDWVKQSGLRPEGNCCQIGCNGYCCAYYDVPCYGIYYCGTVSGLPCDAAHPCVPVLDHVQNWIGYFWIGCFCCEDLA